MKLNLRLLAFLLPCLALGSAAAEYKEIDWKSATLKDALDFTAKDLNDQIRLNKLHKIVDIKKASTQVDMKGVNYKFEDIAFVETDCLQVPDASNCKVKADGDIYMCTVEMTKDTEGKFFMIAQSCYTS